jgi:hypothetical protein
MSLTRSLQLKTMSRRLVPALAGCCSVVLVGCAIPTQATRLSDGIGPVDVEMNPGVPRSGQAAEIVIKSPTADSIVLESANGLDRYWNKGSQLRLWLPPDFGNASGAVRYAERRNGQLLNVMQRPATIRTCRKGSCREVAYEFPLKLPERNQHSVSLTAGWSSVFARRSITGIDRTVLFKEVLNSGIWTVQGEWAGRSWNAQVQGFLTPDEYGGSLDLSRVIKRGDGIRYGLAMHLGVTHSEWLPELGISPIVSDRTAYQASIGPSIMLRGITASSQLGVYADGSETLQIVSTRISANGNLMSVKQPITVTAEKTFAFGGGPIVSRRRDARERITAGIRVLDNFAVKVGVSNHRIAWPSANPADDLHASEVLVTLGGQYSLSW